MRDEAQSLRWTDAAAVMRDLAGMQVLRVISRHCITCILFNMVAFISVREHSRFDVLFGMSNQLINHVLRVHNNIFILHSYTLKHFVDLGNKCRPFLILSMDTYHRVRKVLSSCICIENSDSVKRNLLWPDLNCRN